MGKHTHRKGSRIPIQSSHPGCIWSVILHVIQFHHWHNMKKGLPHRRHGANKHVRGDGNPRKKRDSNAGKLQEVSDDQVNSSNVQEVRKATPMNKNSVKARIKSLIREEFSKRKGRHHRSSTYPVRSQLTRTASIHQLEASHKDSPPEIVSIHESPVAANEINEDSNTPISMHSLLNKSFGESIANEETCEECQAMHTWNDLGLNQVDENETRLIENDTLLEENLEYAKQASFEQKLMNMNDLIRDDSFYRSKEFLDALAIFNLNKEFFLKVLHDPSSPLAQHIRNQQTPNARMALTKSETFPMPGLSSRRVPGPSKLKHKQDVIESRGKEEGKLKAVGRAQNSTECDSIEDICKQSMPSSIIVDRVDEIRKLNQAVAHGDSSSSGSPHHVKNLGSNQVVIKRFKDLKQKIKHVIKESKNERHRIAMDAVLHKVPHSQGFSKDLKHETLEQLKDPPTKSDGKDSPPRSLKSDHTAHIGKRLHRMRRTSSLNESLDKYCQLYESSFNREGKQHTSGTLKLKREEAASPSMSNPKTLGRILSLPELKSYFYQSEDVSDALSSGISTRIPVEGTVSISSLGEQNSTDMPIASEFCSQLDAPVESQIQENLVEVSDTDLDTRDQVGSRSIAEINAEEDKCRDDLSNLMARDSASDSECDIEPKSIDPKEIGESTAEFYISEELEEQLGFLLPGIHDSLIGHQHEYSMDTPRVAHNSEKVEFPSKQVAIEIPYVQVNAKDRAKFDYVKNILELSGFNGSESLGKWHSDYQPVDPSVYEEVEGCILLDPDCSAYEGGNCNHIIFFDLINEVLMETYERSYSYYPTPLSSLCCIHTTLAGNHVLKEVWANISWYLNLIPELDQSLDHVASKDISKNDGWMNLQFSSECVVLEVEDLIFEELLEEVIFS